MFRSASVLNIFLMFIFALNALQVCSFITTTATRDPESSNAYGSSRSSQNKNDSQFSLSNKKLKPMLNRWSEKVNKSKTNRDADIGVKPNREADIGVKPNKEADIGVKPNREAEIGVKKENKDAEIGVKKETKDAEIGVKKETKDAEIGVKKETKDTEIGVKKENSEPESNSVPLKNDSQITRFTSSQASPNILQEMLDILVGKLKSQRNDSEVESSSAILDPDHESLLGTTETLPEDATDSPETDKATNSHGVSALKYSHWADERANKKQKYECVTVLPRLNLNFTKLLGEWYPAKVSLTTQKVWFQSFTKQHSSSNVSESNCFQIEFTKDLNNLSSPLHLILRNGNEFTKMETLLIGDDKYPKNSIWLISWPNGEDTLTSVVATGTVGPDRSQYNWLLFVNCDLSGKVEPDWGVLARPGKGLSNTTLSTILVIAEGLKGLVIEDTVTYEPGDCSQV